MLDKYIIVMIVMNLYDVMIVMEIPNFKDLPKYEPLDTSVNYCNQWKPDMKYQIIHHTCSKICLHM